MKRFVVVFVFLFCACSKEKSLFGLEQDATDNPAESVGSEDGSTPRSFVLGGFGLEAIEFPPALIFRDLEGKFVAKTAAGILDLAYVNIKWSWIQGFVGAEQELVRKEVFSDGILLQRGTETGATLKSKSGQTEVAIEIFEAPGGLCLVARTSGDWNQVRFRFQCEPFDRFYGLGGQSHASEFRGQTIPIRVAEQGLGKDLTIPEGLASIVGHFYDAYFPLPYVLVARPKPETMAYGIVLNSPQRSRFLLCSEESEIIEIQAMCEKMAGECVARLCLIAGPRPKDVVAGFTSMFYRANPVPRWAFGPWIAIVGEPMDVVNEAKVIVEHDIPATAIWDQDYNNYEHPDLPKMAATLHEMGFRVLSYFNSFVFEGTKEFVEASTRGFLPKTRDGNAYVFDMITARASLVDLTNPGARKWMADRLRQAWDTGVDGWMADYGEWIAPDMQFYDGRTGVEYANLYSVDWAKLNYEVMLEKRPDPESSLFFSRSGYLGSNEYLRVVWAGDQLTSFDLLDGLPSVIPYGTSLGLSGVSAFGHDIAGYTGMVAPPSTKELYFRWTELGALSPVMRTHRGLTFEVNWNWDSDPETIAHFRRYALLHLRLLPYLEALHAEAMAKGVPAMRHLVLEFPDWEGAAKSHYEFMLGPALLVAPVIEEGAKARTFEVPPDIWYDWKSGGQISPGLTTVAAPIEEIPVFIRAGGIVPMLDESVRGVLKAPLRPSVSEVEAKALELRVGLGKEGAFTLRDGTSFEVMLSEPGATVGVLLLPEGSALDECGAEQEPEADGCWRSLEEGKIVEAVRQGPGSLVFGVPVTAQGSWELRISGGPLERVYRVFAYGPGPCLENGGAQ